MKTLINITSLCRVKTLKICKTVAFFNIFIMNGKCDANQLSIIAPRLKNRNLFIIT